MSSCLNIRENLIFIREKIGIAQTALQESGVDFLGVQFCDNLNYLSDVLDICFDSLNEVEELVWEKENK